MTFNVLFLFIITNIKEEESTKEDLLPVNEQTRENENNPSTNSTESITSVCKENEQQELEMKKSNITNQDSISKTTTMKTNTLGQIATTNAKLLNNQTSRVQSLTTPTSKLQPKKSFTSNLSSSSKVPNANVESSSNVNVKTEVKKLNTSNDLNQSNASSTTSSSIGLFKPPPVPVKKATSNTQKSIQQLQQTPIKKLKTTSESSDKLGNNFLSILIVFRLNFRQLLSRRYLIYVMNK